MSLKNAIKHHISGSHRTTHSAKILGTPQDYLCLICNKMMYSRVFGGQFFWDLCPLPTPFYCIFVNKFSKIIKIWSFMSGIFFRKISGNLPKISGNFLNFFKIEKKYYYCTQNSKKLLYLSKLGVLCQPFFSKILQNFQKKSWNFLNFFKIEKKKNYFVTKLTSEVIQ